MSKNGDMKERFLRDPFPVRMGNLASNLGRIQAIGEIDGKSTTVAVVIDESIRFVELALVETNEREAAMLRELKVDLSRWNERLGELWSEPSRRLELCELAGAWSDRLVEASGLIQMTPSIKT